MHVVVDSASQHQLSVPQSVSSEPLRAAPVTQHATAHLFLSHSETFALSQTTLRTIHSRKDAPPPFPALHPAARRRDTRSNGHVCPHTFANSNWSFSSQTTFTRDLVCH